MEKDKSKQIVDCNNSIANHERNIKKWERMVADAKSAIAYNKDRIKCLEGLEYYVYVVFVNGEPRYVGKGKKDRYKHAVTGASSCPELNRDYFSNKYIEVMFAKKYLTESQALEEERNWIGQMNDHYWGHDKLYNKDVPAKYDYMDECMEYFYHKWLQHGIDNSSNEGVIVVKPQNKGSVWMRQNHLEEV